MGLGVQITQLRLQKAESIQQVAEKGRADNPSMSLVTRLADHFGVSVASLVGEDLLAGDADPAIARMFRQAGELEPEDLAFLDEMMQSLLRRRRKSGAGV
jgi:transcriptional regulator with XRE-family HTH domain